MIKMRFYLWKFVRAPLDLGVNLGKVCLLENVEPPAVYPLFFFREVGVRRGLLPSTLPERCTSAPPTGAALCAVGQLGVIGLSCAFIIVNVIYRRARKYLARETVPQLQ